MKRLLAIAAALGVLAWAAWGLSVRAARAARPPAPAGELRGAWHVHTVKSDGRGTLDEVVRAARAEGLQFVVVSDHNVLAPEDQGWRDGVLVVSATEASTRYGHVVAVGVPRALTKEEAWGDPLGAIRALGGQAVLAHPLHPRRPFTGWGTGPWRGFEIVSNDTAWYRVLADHDAGRAATALAALPWDPARAVLRLSDDPRDELARFDRELASARAAGEGARSARVLLCSADAHGYPSYAAAFGAFSMHVPVSVTKDGAADARAVSAALLDGRAACVLDGLAPASGVRLEPLPDGRLRLSLEAPDLSRAAIVAVHDGRPLAAQPAGTGTRLDRVLDCGAARCAPGDWRVELTWDGRPWIFTNPVAIE